MSYTRDFLFKALVFPWAISSCFLIMKPLTTLLWSHSHLSLADEATQPSILLHYYEAPCTSMEPLIYIRSLLTDLSSLWWSHSIEYRHRHDVSGSLMPDFDEATIFGMKLLWNRQHLYIWVKTKPLYVYEATRDFMKPPWTQGSSVRVASVWEPGY